MSSELLPLYRDIIMRRFERITKKLEDDVTVVIPVLNEAEALPHVLREVKEVGVKNIIVVDGGSEDGSPEIARREGAFVIFQEGKGKADAIRSAVPHVRTPYVVIMDGDYTYPAHYIKDLYLKAVEENLDYVIGVRVPTEGSMKKVFRLGNKILNKAFNVVFGGGLSDVLSGMYLLRTEVLKELNWETKGFSLETEIAAHVISTSGKVGEVRIEYRKRIGEKKLGVRHGFLIARDIMRLAWRYNPVFFIFCVGGLMLIPGLILGIYVAYHYFFHGINYHVKGLIAIILTIGGFISVLLAIMSLFVKRMEWRLLHQIKQSRDILREILLTFQESRNIVGSENDPHNITDKVTAQSLTDPKNNKNGGCTQN